MGIIWDEYDNEDMFQEFSTPFLWFQARQSPALREGLNKTNTGAIFGYYYEAQVAVDLVRTSINLFITNSDNGRIYKGGCKLQIPPTKYVNSAFVRLPIFDNIFKGDVLVALNKPIRDFDVLTKGIRDKVFAFDIKTILSVTAVDANSQEVTYYYGTDYVIKIDGIEYTVIANQLYPIGEGQVGVIPAGGQPYPITFAENNSSINVKSNIEIIWTVDGKHPAEGEKYGIEFTCSPNYVVWDNAPKPRGTSDNDLSKVVLCVKRAFFNDSPNPLDKIDTNQKIMGHNPVYVDQDYDDNV
jgi:hypothetical protein